MLKTLFEDPFLETLATRLNQTDSALMEELWSSPKALLLSLLLQKHQRTILLISGVNNPPIIDDFPTFGNTALELPSWETLPGEEIAPSADIVGRRFEVLQNILDPTPKIIVATFQAVLQKVVDKKEFSGLCQEWKKGSKIGFADLEVILEILGYKRAPVVSDKGEYALRGGICDIFPLTTVAPVRIEFFGDEIDTLRIFDPVGQKSIEKIESFLLTPASELSLIKESKKLMLITEYLPKDTLIVFDQLEALEDHAIALSKLPGSHSRAFASPEEFFTEVAKKQKIFFSEKNIEDLSAEAHPEGEKISFSWCNHAFESVRCFHPFIDITTAFSPLDNENSSLFDIRLGVDEFSKKGGECLFLSSTGAEEETLKEKFCLGLEHQSAFHFEKGYLTKGFVYPKKNIAVIPFTEFSHRPKLRRQKWRVSTHTPASEFHELQPKDTVVHFNHGIAKFLGIEKRPNNTGALTEFLVLEYAENSKLYVPISQAHLVSRYIGSHEEVPTYSVLGSTKWHKTKALAQASIVGYAEQLLHKNAEREIAGGFAFPEDSYLMQRFEEDFPFMPTDDQIKAIHEIKADMQSSKAMDRLICGDVGYGKTEVAMRAAFKTVTDGKKQVALLVPTTVLAVQHYESFCERMSNFRMVIRCISRFSSAKEAKAILAEVAEGKVDILIGTHRLISKDVHFANLGLIIIDEEQRFGVRAKESLKAFKAGVDSLTLSATPIPRTLYMTIVGAKDISIINTPPQDRLPIKTILAERDDALIKNALLRELSRDGQAFFIHNRVENILSVKEALERLVPQAKIAISHGQMEAGELDTVFHAFKQGRIDILVTTTIVENGIDIPNANTILIDKADHFGIADLYQLRGRVGRWNRPAYAYFLTTKGKSLPEIAHRRLEAMLSSSGHGGGLKVAMRDLEIRGAGDILGTQQSGHVSQIGFHLYCKLLKKTIEALQRKKAPSFLETKMEFTFDASLSESYVNETSLRMEIYHRLGESNSPQEVDNILEELKDRFGPPPNSVLWLMHMTRLRILATGLYFLSLKFENFTFLAEKQQGGQSVKKVLPLPKTSDPALFETQVFEALQKAF